MENMNTLEVYTTLKKAKFTELQSKELANLLGKYYETEPASKYDLKETEISLKQDLKESESSLKQDLKNTESDIRLELKNTELRLQREIEQIRLETHSVRLEVQTVKVELVRWMIGVVFGAAGLLAVFLKYMK